MKEAFLHYVWQYQKFLTNQLVTTMGQQLHVLKTGFHNTDAGPDFSEAVLMLDDMQWSGAVEIHIKSSDWKTHGHSKDKAYQNVILHVVWEEDEPINYENGQEIPTLQLKNKVSPSLLAHYQKLIGTSDGIPCASNWSKGNQWVVSQMLENCLVERLYEKSIKAEIYYEKAAGDWQATTYFMLLSSMGFKINQHAFERLAYLLPLDLIRKYDGQPDRVVALLFGSAGFLEEEFDESEVVRNQLKQDWNYLRHKHNLKSIVSKQEWKFLRLRPANFPTVRLSQVAYILSISQHLYQSFVLQVDTKSMMKLLRGEVQDLWHMKNFDQPKLAKLGIGSIHTLMLNVSPPLLALYGRKTDNPMYLEKALSLLEHLKAERNSVTRIYESLGVDIKSAYDSQGFLQLYSSYCQPKKCLNCKIGLAIMKNAS